MKRINRGLEDASRKKEKMRSNSPTIDPETRDWVASSELETLEMVTTEFEGLNKSAHEKATGIATIAKALAVAWDELLPILSKMQSLLSQRGENRKLLHDANLPTWSGWWKSFQKETGLHVTLHAVQVRLKKFRSMGNPMDASKHRRGQAVQLSAGNQVRVLTKLQCANEMAKALKAGAEYRDLLEEFLSSGIDSEHIDRWITVIREGANTLESALMPTVSTAAAPNSVANTPALSQQPVKAAQPLVMPKTGDDRGLFDLVSESWGYQIRTALEGLPQEAMVNVFGAFVMKLAHAHCQYDSEGGEIVVKVEYIPADRSAVDRAA